MYSELECGICYLVYNAGRRCPRELHCRHTFCESCLLALSRPPQGAPEEEGADRTIVCPLCRHTTSIPADSRVKVELRVDECALEKLVSAGVLDREDEDDQEEDDRPLQDVSDDREEGTTPESPAEEGDSSPATRGGRLRQSWRKVWKRMSGKGSRQNCMTNEDMRSLAMMSSYMF